MDDAIKEHMGLVKTIVERFNPKNDTIREDLISAGTIGLWKALEKYDESKNKGGKISTFLWNPIRWHVIHEMKRIKKGSAVSLSKCPEPIAPIDSQLWEYMDSRTITDEERKIVALRAEGYKFREIGYEIGKTKAAAENKFYRTIRKIRKLNG